MQKSLVIKSQYSLENIETAIIDTIATSVDYIYSEYFEKRGVKRYILYVKSKEELPAETVSFIIADLILNNYEMNLLSEILTNSFTEFSQYERNKILRIAQDKAEVYNEIYNYRYIVKKISNYLKNQNIISIDGFLKFRLFEYRRELEMLLCEAIEDFYVEQELCEFIDLMAEYVSISSPLIDLVHIKANPDKSFSFYDFKKNSISFMIYDDELFNNLFTEEEKIISVLLSIMPKRIIWHCNNEFENYNLLNTLKKIFKERFTICFGCEFCKI